MKVGEAVVGLGVGAEVVGVCVGGIVVGVCVGGIVVGVNVKVGFSVGEVDGMFVGTVVCIAVGEIVVGFRVGEAVGIPCRKFCVTCAAVKAVK